MTEHWCACGEDINGHEWQASAKRHLDLATEYRLRAEQAEAAIARVRDVCDLWQRRHDTSIRHPTAIPAIPITAALRALEGDSDD